MKKPIPSIPSTLAILASACFAITGSQAATTTYNISSFGALGSPDVLDEWKVSAQAGGGTASIVDLTGLGGNLEFAQPLPVSAALLTTGASNADRAEVITRQNFGLASSVLTSVDLMYSYYKSSIGDLNPAAAPSLKLEILALGGMGDNYGQLIFEPYWNQGFGNPLVAPADSWQTIVIDETTGQGDGDNVGGWSWSGGFEIGGAPGGPPLRSLSEWATAFAAADATDFANASVIGISVGVGTFNQGQTGYFDAVGIKTGSIDKKYNFELARVAPVPDGGSMLAMLGMAVGGLIGMRRFIA